MAIRIIDFATGFETDQLPGTTVPASAIEVTPAGDLGSTNVQSALVELQGDIDAAEAATAAHLANLANPHSVTKTQVGLGNADNTSDANKPVSTAQQTALNLKADTSTVTASLALKADASTTTAALALKLAKANDTATGLTIGDTLDMTQVATPSAPTTGKTRVYSKSDGKIYKLPFGGSEAEIGSGGLAGLEIAANVSPAVNGTMYEYGTLAAPYTFALPSGTTAFVIAVMGSASSTNTLSVSALSGTIRGAADTYVFRYPNFNAVFYRAAGSSDIQIQLQAATLYMPDAGTYTPTLTNGTNVASSTANPCRYSRVGNIVTVSGTLACPATTASNTQSLISVSLPIASNLTSSGDIGGSATREAASGTAASAGSIGADAANDRAVIQFNATETASRTTSFIFQYEVK